MLYACAGKYIKSGLRYNPFCKPPSHRMDAVFSGDETIKSIIDSNLPVFQIVGGSGFGKSTLLYAIEDSLRKTGQDVRFHYCRDREELPPELFKSPWILLDEAQRLNRQDFINHVSSCLGKNVRIIMASHMDHRAWFSDKDQPGTLYLSALFRKHLKGMIEKALVSASPGKPRHIVSPEALGLIEEYAEGSMEKARSLLYEIFLSDPQPGVIGLRPAEEAKRALCVKTHGGL